MKQKWKKPLLEVLEIKMTMKFHGKPPKGDDSDDSGDDSGDSGFDS